ncbi:hypothetical protein NPIL_603911 [Nephila pilipes]|uniref:Uncharacterized protein n=1 Tax=Nephila pilipes TaxID=299642 RepID=A0A8X6PEU7_NEPPI|nr:hypothetical protein NPIL_603911 [Nephila pilipes]
MRREKGITEKRCSVVFFICDIKEQFGQRHFRVGGSEGKKKKLHESNEGVVENQREKKFCLPKRNLCSLRYDVRGRGSAVWKRSLRQDEESQSNTSQHHGRGNGAKPPVGARAALGGRTSVDGAARDGRGVGGCPSAQWRVSDHSLIGNPTTLFLPAVPEIAIVSNTCH